MCRPLGVTRGGYYRHLNKAVDYYHLELIEAVQELAKDSDHTYGSRRMKVALGLMSYPVSRNKAKKPMKEAGALVKRRKKFKVTTDSNHAKPLFDNILDRDFAPKAPDQAYVQDITYIWTQEGWLYLATVIDLYSRRVVGWSMGSRMTAQLVCDALRMAIWRRRELYVEYKLLINMALMSSNIRLCYIELSISTLQCGLEMFKRNLWSLKHLTLFHHKADISQCRNIDGRIFVNGDQICIFSHFKTSQ